MWILWVLGGIVLLAFLMMLYCLCAAGPRDDEGDFKDQMEYFRKEYEKQQRKKIRVKVDGRYY